LRRGFHKDGNKALRTISRLAFLVSLSLSGCGGVGPECGSLDARSLVLKNALDDSNNPLANYAAKNSSVVEAKANRVSTEAEKSEVRKTAARAASYRLDEAIITNSVSRDKRSATCSGLLYATVEDATAQKQVDFKVEQGPDGKVSVSVTPFRF